MYFFFVLSHLYFFAGRCNNLSYFTFAHFIFGQSKRNYDRRFTFIHFPEMERTTFRKLRGSIARQLQRTNFAFFLCHRDHCEFLSSDTR